MVIYNYFDDFDFGYFDFDDFDYFDDSNIFFEMDYEYMIFF